MPQDNLPILQQDNLPLVPPDNECPNSPVNIDEADTPKSTNQSGPPIQEPVKPEADTKNKLDAILLESMCHGT